MTRQPRDIQSGGIYSSCSTVALEIMAINSSSPSGLLTSPKFSDYYRRCWRDLGKKSHKAHCAIKVEASHQNYVTTFTLVACCSVKECIDAVIEAGLIFLCGCSVIDYSKGREWPYDSNTGSGAYIRSERMHRKTNRAIFTSSCKNVW